MIIIAALAFMALLLAFVAAVHLNDRRKLRASSSSLVVDQCSWTVERADATIVRRRADAWAS